MNTIQFPSVESSERYEAIKEFAKSLDRKIGVFVRAYISFTGVGGTEESAMKDALKTYTFYEGRQYKAMFNCWNEPENLGRNRRLAGYPGEPIIKGEVIDGPITLHIKDRMDYFRQWGDDDYTVKFYPDFAEYSMGFDISRGSDRIIAGGFIYHGPKTVDEFDPAEYKDSDNYAYWGVHT